MVSGGIPSVCWRNLHEVAASRTWEHTFPGLLEEVPQARRWTRDILRGKPFVDDAVSIVTELINNAILHTASGGDFGRFFLAYAVSDWGVTLSVADEGGEGGVPQLKHMNDESERGRGLGIVTELAHRTMLHRAFGGYRVAADLLLCPPDVTGH
ncbi:ATP-binding protein [Streptomyces uncialis]|uniref:ATP-binding protein n=1 Tax=Streptomyces uncialis TaxID=1048205 RepID=UPI0033F20B0F